MSPRTVLSRGRWLAALIVGLGAWAAWSLARHPGFQPASTLRASAPVLALLIGAAFTHQVAGVRQRIDVDGEFNTGGRALFLGAVMLTATALAWLLVSQALPAAVTAAVGIRRAEPGVVVRKVPLADDPACRYRLEVASGTTGSGAIVNPMDECVSEAIWNQSAAGDRLTLDLIASPLGAEIVGVRR